MNILIRLFVLFLESKQELKAFDVITTLIGGNTKIIAQAIRNLSLSQELELRKRFGHAIVNRAKQSVGINTLKSMKPTRTINAVKSINNLKSPNKSNYTNSKTISETSKTKDTSIDLNNTNSIPTTATTKSGWIQSISWQAELNMLTLKTKKSPKYYKLPFFPRHVAVAMLTNESPGKTLWNGYWRVFGRGKFDIKRKTKLQQKAKSNVSNQISKIANRREIGKKILSNTQIKVLKIPKTGIKGIKITNKFPKFKK